MFQVELSAFRAKWMSELQPSGGEQRSFTKSADLKRKQEIAKEEKVHSHNFNFLCHSLYIKMYFKK